MSMYNLIHGMNPLSSLILASLDLTQSDCGRFRDCHIDEEGRVVVYTRNGGGNRECWHSETPSYGSPKCTHTTMMEDVPEHLEMTEEEATAKGYKLLPVFIGSKRLVETGRIVKQTQYICLKPCTIECACPGCIINYRLPAHPLYISDSDDEFDSTYASIFFKMPDSAKPVLELMKEKVDTAAQWKKAIDDIKNGKRPEVVQSLAPLFDVLNG